VLDGIFSNSEEEVLDSLNKVQNFIRIFYDQAGGKKYDIRYHGAAICWVMAKANADLAHLPQPSIFKKAGQFTLHFVLNNPITTELPDAWYLDEISHLNVQNAILAFEICRQSFFNAIIHGADGEDKPLLNKITPSHHQLVDIIKSLATIQPVPAAYDTYSRLMALVYESLAYEFNPHCRYKCKTPSGDATKTL
jgi:hypothetical protein